MRTETVTAETVEDALDLCPWAAVAIEVDPGPMPDKAWKCFESAGDVEAWGNQK